DERVRSAAARHRGNDHHLAAVGDGGTAPTASAGVLIADVHVDVGAQGAGVVEHPRRKTWVAPIDLGDHLAERSARGGDLALAARSITERAWQADGHGHDFT